MDIHYLLFLQDFRFSIHDAWTPFLEGVSLFAVTYLILVPIFIYWCLNKHNGLLTIGATFLSMAVNAVVKLSVCAYRPWIRDARLFPAADAIKTATGYSFPSGHTMGATPIYGGMALWFWEKKITRWLSVLCILAILVTGFSRNYLGVHTPQDVIVGLVLGVVSLAITVWVLHHPEQENKCLWGGLIGCALALLYITVKPYPLDYVDGKLLVDPAKMMNNGYSELGALAAFCVARYTEKRWIRFQATGCTVKGVIFCFVGLLLLGVINTHLQAPFVAALGPHWGRFCSQFIIVFYIIALYPLVLKWLAAPKS